MNSTLYTAFLNFLLFSVISCHRRSRYGRITSRILTHRVDSRLENLLEKSEALTAEQVENFLQNSEELGGLDVLRYVKDPEIADVILNYAGHMSPSKRIYDLDSVLSELSRKVASEKPLGFSIDDPDYDLAYLYVTEIANLVSSPNDWPTMAVYQLLRDGHTNVIEMFLDNDFPVDIALRDCYSLLSGTDFALKKLIPHGLDVSQCGKFYMEVMHNPELTPGKLDVFFLAGLPLDYEYYAWNWLEKALLFGRYDLAKCAYENGIKLSFRRLENNHYWQFRITPDMFIEYLAEPEITRTRQSLAIVAQHRNGPISRLPEETVEDIKDKVHDIAVDHVKRRLFKP